MPLSANTVKFNNLSEKTDFTLIEHTKGTEPKQCFEGKLINTILTRPSCNSLGANRITTHCRKHVAPNLGAGELMESRKGLFMEDACPRSRSAEYVEEDPCSNPHIQDTIGEVVERRYNRRTILKTLAGTAAGMMIRPASAKETSVGPQSAGSPSSLKFQELDHGRDARALVAPGYDM